MSDKPAAITYPNRAHEGTHPDRLSVHARLLGVPAAPAEKCRVLDLGCAGGANLVSMALDLPNSEFVGIDLSPQEIASGHALIEAMGVKNVKLLVMSVMDVTREAVGGTFDFIVAHGLYSWVDKAAQAKILALFGDLLTPNGVAYVSYNTLPGWYTRAKARDLMLFHTASLPDPNKKVEQGLASLKWLSDAIGTGEPYGQEMAAELALLRSTNAGYIFHEHFVETSATYFHQIVAAAAANGLQYLTESDATARPLETLPPGVREVMAKVDDPVKAEQYIDFAIDRRFRATMFCRKEHTVNRAMDLAPLATGYVSAAAQIEGDPFDLTETPVAIASAQGARAQLAQPLLKMAIGTLVSRTPEPMSIAGLVEATAARVAFSPRPGAFDEAMARLPSELAGSLLRLSIFGFVKVRGFAPTVTSKPSDKPIARPLVRLQAPIADGVTTNVWHQSIGLTATERAVAPLLDGTRDRDAIALASKQPKADVDAALARLGQIGALVG